MPAVFLDRDGTLIEDRGSLRSPAQVVFYPETIAALRRIQQRFRLFIVTNQSCVAAGEVAIQEANEVNDFVVQWLRLKGVTIVAVYCCPHQRSDGCVCIKPNPHFLLHAAQWHGVDLHRSFVVGDHPQDVELARNAGARGIYVLTGHGQKHRSKLDSGEIVVTGIAAAADWLLGKMDASSALDGRSHPKAPLAANAPQLAE